VNKVYALKLISCIFPLRPERTQECILNAPLGTSRLVATLTLDVRNPAIPINGLGLLRVLTQSSTELQKLVAFENAFDRTFSLIHAHGGLDEGGIFVQDCLEFLANLVNHNPSNQSLFRETGCVSKLAGLLHDAQTGLQDDEDSKPWERNRSIFGLLSVIRLFLTEGGVGVQENQNSFSAKGLLQQMLMLAFSPGTDVRIKAEVSIVDAKSMPNFTNILIGSLYMRRYDSGQPRYSKSLW
jgi:intracellular protein transport protein USO1